MATQYPPDQPIYPFHAANLAESLDLIERIRSNLELRAAWQDPVTVTGEDHNDMVMAKSLLAHLAKSLDV